MKSIKVRLIQSIPSFISFLNLFWKLVDLNAFLLLV